MMQLATIMTNAYNHLLTAFVMLNVEVKIQQITDKFITVSRPLAIMALIFAILTYVAEPMLPESARENKGVVRRVLFALMCVGLVPDIVSLIAG